MSQERYNECLQLIDNELCKLNDQKKYDKLKHMLLSEKYITLNEMSKIQE